MKIELIKGWNGNPPGTVIEPQVDDAAVQLVQRGIAKYIEQPKPKPKRIVKLQAWVK